VYRALEATTIVTITFVEVGRTKKRKEPRRERNERECTSNGSVWPLIPPEAQSFIFNSHAL